MKNINIVLLFGAFAILVGRADNSSVHNEDNTRKVLLRKLQNFQENEPKTVTWNEILANVLVSKITRKPAADYVEPNNQNILSECFSKVLWFYKIYFYDKLWKKSPPLNSFDNGYPSTTPTIEWLNIGPATTTEVSNTPRIDTVTTKPDLNDTFLFDPKSEVEIIEPRYHGKLKETLAENNASEDTPLIYTTETTGVKSEASINEENCPDGTERDADGNCVDPKASNFILYIPRHCPLGYKMDKQGFCREIW